MKLCRFNGERLGLVEGTLVRDVTQALDVLPHCTYPLPRHDLMIAHLDEVRTRVAQLAPGAASLPLSGVTLLSPIANPGKIVAAPVNYQKHLDEVRAQVEIHNNNSGHMAEIRRIGLFLKATSSLVGPSAGVRISHPERRNDHEAELVAVVGTRVRNVSVADAMKHVAGYSIGLDMTTRGPEERSLRKSIDSYSVLGPWFVTADELAHPQALDFWLTVNGEARQRANTRDLVMGIAELIAFASSFYTLEPGDLIYTGTPEGVGPVVAGDTIVTEFEGIGRMTVDVLGSDEETA